MVSDDAA